METVLQVRAQDGCPISEPKMLAFIKDAGLSILRIKYDGDICVVVCSGVDNISDVVSSINIRSISSYGSATDGRLHFKIISNEDDVSIGRGGAIDMQSYTSRLSESTESTSSHSPTCITVRCEGFQRAKKEDIFALLGSFDNVKSISALHDNNSYSVEFTTPYSYLSAVKALNGYKFQGYLIEASENTSIHVRNKYNSNRNDSASISSASSLVPKLSLAKISIAHSDTRSAHDVQDQYRNSQDRYMKPVLEGSNVLQMSDTAAADIVHQMLIHAPMYVSPFNSPRLEKNVASLPPKLNLSLLQTSQQKNSYEIPSASTSSFLPATEARLPQSHQQLHYQQQQELNNSQWELSSDVSSSSLSDSFASTLDTEDSRFVDTQQGNWMWRGDTLSNSGGSVGSNSRVVTPVLGAAAPPGLDILWGQSWQGAVGGISSRQQDSIVNGGTADGLGGGLFLNKADPAFDSFLSVDPDFLSTPRLMASSIYNSANPASVVSSAVAKSNGSVISQSDHTGVSLSAQSKGSDSGSGSGSSRRYGNTAFGQSNIASNIQTTQSSVSRSPIQMSTARSDRPAPREFSRNGYVFVEQLSDLTLNNSRNTDRYRDSQSISTFNASATSQNWFNSSATVLQVNHAPGLLPTNLKETRPPVEDNTNKIRGDYYRGDDSGKISITATAESLSKGGLGGVDTPPFIPKQLQGGPPPLILQPITSSRAPSFSASTARGQTVPPNMSRQSGSIGPYTGANEYDRTYGNELDEMSNLLVEGEYSVHSGQFEPDIRNVFVGNIGRLPVGGVQMIIDYFGALQIEVLKVDIKVSFAFLEVRDAPGLTERINAININCGGHPPPFGKDRRILRIEFVQRASTGKQNIRLRRESIQHPTNSLFVVGFDHRRSPEILLTTIFAQFGPLEYVEVKNNYAFIKYFTVENSIAAQKAVHGMVIQDRTLSVEYSSRKIMPGAGLSSDSRSQSSYGSFSSSDLSSAAGGPVGINSFVYRGAAGLGGSQSINRKLEYGYDGRVFSSGLEPPMDRSQQLAQGLDSMKPFPVGTNIERIGLSSRSSSGEFGSYQRPAVSGDNFDSALSSRSFESSVNDGGKTFSSRFQQPQRLTHITSDLTRSGMDQRQNQNPSPRQSEFDFNSKVEDAEWNQDKIRGSYQDRMRSSDHYYSTSDSNYSHLSTTSQERVAEPVLSLNDESNFQYDYSESSSTSVNKKTVPR